MTATEADIAKVLIALWMSTRIECLNVGDEPRPDCLCDTCEGQRAFERLERLID